MFLDQRLYGNGDSMIMRGVHSNPDHHGLERLRLQLDLRPLPGREAGWRMAGSRIVLAGAVTRVVYLYRGDGRASGAMSLAVMREAAGIN